MMPEKKRTSKCQEELKKANESNAILSKELSEIKKAYLLLKDDYNKLNAKNEELYKKIDFLNKKLQKRVGPITRFFNRFLP